MYKDKKINFIQYLVDCSSDELDDVADYFLNTEGANNYQIIIGTTARFFKQIEKELKDVGVSDDFIFKLKQEIVNTYLPHLFVHYEVNVLLDKM